MIPGTICMLLVAETSVSISEARLRGCALKMLWLASKNAVLTTFEAFHFPERLGKSWEIWISTRFCRTVEVCVPD